MKVRAAALVLTLGAAATTTAFSPHPPPSRTSSSTTNIRLGMSTLDRPKSSSSVSPPPPVRVSPDAGHIPDWEGRTNPTSSDEFMNSDPNMSNVGETMWECPLTRWDAENIDVSEAQRTARDMPSCPLEVRATASDNAMGAEYFVVNRERLRDDLLRHGAIWFRGFELMKTVRGNRIMHESLDLQPCLDPLHSSGLRKFASERDALYEEVSFSFLFFFLFCARGVRLVRPVVLRLDGPFPPGRWFLENGKTNDVNGRTVRSGRSVGRVRSGRGGAGRGTHFLALGGGGISSAFSLPLPPPPHPPSPFDDVPCSHIIYRVSNAPARGKKKKRNRPACPPDEKR